MSTFETQQQDMLDALNQLHDLLKKSRRLNAMLENNLDGAYFNVSTRQINAIKIKVTPDNKAFVRSIIKQELRAINSERTQWKNVLEKRVARFNREF